MTIEARPIAISAEPTGNPQVCRFTVDRPVREGRTVHCRRREDAAGSPLLEALFALPDVREVLVSGRGVTVATDGERPWQVLGPSIGAAIRGALADAAGGTPLFAPAWDEDRPTAVPDDARARIEQLLDESINPQIASHGGFVRVVDLQGATVYLEMGGGCQGCASSQATLRHGVEQAIRQAVPEIAEVVDVTDHAAGENPYFR
jgi:NFU1 iron-sulfur cluster scaffold homolog, mitochondrial